MQVARSKKKFFSITICSSYVKVPKVLSSYAYMFGFICLFSLILPFKNSPSCLLLLTLLTLPSVYNYLALARSQLPTYLDQLRSNSLAIVHIMAILELPNTFYFWCITHSITSYTSTFLNIFPQIILKFTSNTSVT